MSASSRVDLNLDQGVSDQTRKFENFGDGKFPAMKPTYGRQTHTHHMLTGRNAPKNSNLEFFRGEIPTQNKPPPQQFTHSQKFATHNLHEHIANGWTNTAETKTQTQAVLTTNLLKQLQTLHPSNRRLQYSKKQQRTQ